MSISTNNHKNAAMEKYLNKLLFHVKIVCLRSICVHERKHAKVQERLNSANE